MQTVSLYSLHCLLGFYIISMWYKRHETQKRFSILMSSATLAATFGSLLASAIGKMEGIGGYSGWRWIFILEGCLTCLIAFAAYFLITDFPHDAQWLTDDKREMVIARLRQDQGDISTSHSVTVTDIVEDFKDYTNHLGALMYFGKWYHHSPIVNKRGLITHSKSHTSLWYVLMHHPFQIPNQLPLTLTPKE